MERRLVPGSGGAEPGGAGETVRRGNAETVRRILSEWLFFVYGDARSESQEQAENGLLLALLLLIL